MHTHSQNLPHLCIDLISFLPALILQPQSVYPCGHRPIETLDLQAGSFGGEPSEQGMTRHPPLHVCPGYVDVRTAT